VQILAIETASNSLSVSIAKNNKILFEEIIEPSNQQSELLIDIIEKGFKACKIDYKDLNLVATSKGPGRFTGTRTGLIVARTIKLAKNTPLILLNSCEILANQYTNLNRNIAVILDANTDQFFFAYYKNKQGQLNEIQAPKLVNIEDLHKILSEKEEGFILCTDMEEIKDLKFKIDYNKSKITSSLIAKIAHDKFLAQGESKNLEPLYLRSPKITKRKK